MSSAPYGMLAELTYRCPLHCPYCSNPLNLSPAAVREELALMEWSRVLEEARALGVLQLHLSGGEPLQRDDLADIVARARLLGLYTNLITSAVGLTPSRAERLKRAGLDHVQISIQAAEPVLSDRLAGAPAYRRKVTAAHIIKSLDMPLTLNVVLHQRNIDEVAAILSLAEELQADRIELANTQYYGWALRNRSALMPSREQLQRAEIVVRAARERLGGRMQIIYVLPDYYGRYPKPCMGGWGRHQLTVAPNGDVLPCPAASQVAGLPIESVRRRPLDWIWYESPLFNLYRGVEWMPQPCRSCPRNTIDYGGCRCQAFLLTGDAGVTDPVCEFSPHHDVVMTARESAHPASEHSRLVYRHLRGLQTGAVDP